MILMIDNYDSFTYNLYQDIGVLNPDIKVFRNDAITIEKINVLSPSHIILSPGPKTPKDAGICKALIQSFSGRIPILGVCLGHQAICETFGGKIVLASHPVHGKSDLAQLDLSCPVFKGLKEQITVGRYHSLCADPATLPSVLRVTARTPDGCIMAVAHERFPVFGLQFHPESVLTPEGTTIIRNFLNLS